MSLVLINTENGNKLFNKVTDYLTINNCDFKLVVKANDGLHSAKGYIPYKQLKVYRDIESESLDNFDKKASLKKRLAQKLPKKIKSIFKK